ncbi:hypothetical protein FF011L_39960 [Roseimaritima multifibrata]|uniref:TIGR03545 family protein n=1 Tax=Roseimaritima multifibrata TaxID=1930274 RepID=A0A517MK02_9BACT|nr:TIGR03545 family protein [Roseimaritima multifibrata]QDS95203.1 hypothetical protein FF011L_39960 [Roseimaritima multifibrata]
MIRWRFLIPRILIVVVVIALLRWSIGPIVQYASVQALEASVGARVDIASTTVGLFPPRLEYAGLQIGDPREGKSHTNAFQADLVSFELDGNALLKRRWVARSGRISGLKIGEGRDSSGHLEVPEVIEEPAGPSMLGQWLGGFTDQAVDGLESFGKDLETYQRSEEIRQRWEAEYASLKMRAESLEVEVRAIRDEAKGIDNPLRDLPRLQATIARAEAVRKELIAIRSKLDSLPQQVQVDWLAMEQAKQNDLNRVKEFVPQDFRDTDKIGPDLFKGIVQGQIDRVRSHLDTAREIAGWTITEPIDVERTRGDDIRLVAGPLPPSLLVQQCQIDGDLSINNEVYTMTGILENLTPQTERLTEPLRARMRLEGPRVVRVDFQRYFDEKRPKPRDVLTIHWPNLEVRPHHIGNSDDAQLAIRGGDLDLYVQIEAIGDEMHGKLISRQADTHLALETSAKISELAAVQSLQSRLSSIDRLEVQAEFSGTWSDLDMSLSTNLTGVLSEGMKEAFNVQIADAKQKLNTRIQVEHQQQMAKLQDLLGKQHMATRDILAKADLQIDELKSKLVSELPSASTYLGTLESKLRGLR